MRWFQFDLRLLFVVLTAVGVILALEIARRSEGTRAKGLTSTIKVGDQVVLSEHQHGFEITRQKGVVSHTVTEVGRDYLRLKSIDGPVSLIPLEKIYRIVDDPRPYGATASGGGMGGMPPGGMGAPGGVGPGAGGFGPRAPGIMGSGGPGGSMGGSPGGQFGAGGGNMGAGMNPFAPGNQKVQNQDEGAAAVPENAFLESLPDTEVAPKAGSGRTP